MALSDDEADRLAANMDLLEAPAVAYTHDTATAVDPRDCYQCAGCLAVVVAPGNEPGSRWVCACGRSSASRMADGSVAIDLLVTTGD